MMTTLSRRYGTRVKRRSHFEIRETAAGIRKVLGITSPWIDMIDLLENKLDPRGIRYHYAPDDELGEDIGRWVPAEGRIVIALSAYESLSAGEPEHLLLVPHEMGHWALSHQATLGWSVETADHPFVEDSEWQAAVFALEFTMPPDIVGRDCRSTADMMRLFGVTERDAGVRALMLRVEGLISW